MAIAVIIVVFMIDVVDIPSCYDLYLYFLFVRLHLRFFVVSNAEIRQFQKREKTRLLGVLIAPDLETGIIGIRRRGGGGRGGI